MKPNKPTRADLKRRILELEAAMASRCYFGAQNLSQAGADLKGSGVLLQLTALGGREIISPVIIRDGLSPETIAALRNDIKRSYEMATELKP